MYLTAELIPLALLGNYFDTGKKQAMADKSLQFQKWYFPAHRFGTAFGTPGFPTPSDVVQSIDFTYFIGEDSWFFFGAFNPLHDTLLSTPESEWEQM